MSDSATKKSRGDLAAAGRRKLEEFRRRKEAKQTKQEHKPDEGAREEHVQPSSAVAQKSQTRLTTAPPAAPAAEIKVTLSAPAVSAQTSTLSTAQVRPNNAVERLQISTPPLPAPVQVPQAAVVNEPSSRTYLPSATHVDPPFSSSTYAASAAQLDPPGRSSTHPPSAAHVDPPIAAGSNLSSNSSPRPSTAQASPSTEVITQGISQHAAAGPASTGVLFPPAPPPTSTQPFLYHPQPTTSPAATLSHAAHTPGHSTSASAGQIAPAGFSPTPVSQPAPTSLPRPVPKLPTLPTSASNPPAVIPSPAASPPSPDAPGLFGGFNAYISLANETIGEPAVKPPSRVPSKDNVLPTPPTSTGLPKSLTLPPPPPSLKSATGPASVDRPAVPTTTAHTITGSNTFPLISPSQPEPNVDRDSTSSRAASLLSPNDTPRGLPTEAAAQRTEVPEVAAFAPAPASNRSSATPDIITPPPAPQLSKDSPASSVPVSQPAYSAVPAPTQHTPPVPASSRTSLLPPTPPTSSEDVWESAGTTSTSPISPALPVSTNAPAGPTPSNRAAAAEQLPTHEATSVPLPSPRASLKDSGSSAVRVIPPASAAESSTPPMKPKPKSTTGRIWSFTSALLAPPPAVNSSASNSTPSPNPHTENAQSPTHAIATEHHQATPLAADTQNEAKAPPPESSSDAGTASRQSDGPVATRAGHEFPPAVGSGKVDVALSPPTSGRSLTPSTPPRSTTATSFTLSFPDPASSTVVHSTPAPASASADVHAANSESTGGNKFTTSSLTDTKPSPLSSLPFASSVARPPTAPGLFHTRESAHSQPASFLPSKPTWAMSNFRSTLSQPSSQASDSRPATPLSAATPPASSTSSPSFLNTTSRPAFNPSGDSAPESSSVLAGSFPFSRPTMANGNASHSSFQPSSTGSTHTTWGSTAGQSWLDSRTSPASSMAVPLHSSTTSSFPPPDSSLSSTPGLTPAATSTFVPASSIFPPRSTAPPPAHFFTPSANTTHALPSSTPQSTHPSAVSFAPFTTSSSVNASFPLPPAAPSITSHPRPSFLSTAPKSTDTFTSFFPLSAPLSSNGPLSPPAEPRSTSTFTSLFPPTTSLSSSTPLSLFPPPAANSNDPFSTVFPPAAPMPEAPTSSLSRPSSAASIDTAATGQHADTGMGPSSRAASVADEGHAMTNAARPSSTGEEERSHKASENSRWQQRFQPTGMSSQQQQQIKALQQHVEELMEDKMELSRGLAQQGKLNETLVDENSALMERYNTTAKALEEAQKKIKQYEAEITAQRLALDTMCSERDTARLLLKEAQDRSTALATETVNLERELLQVKSSKLLLEKQRNEHGTQLNSHEKQAKRAAQEVAHLTSLLEASQEEVRILAEKLRELEASRRSEPTPPTTPNRAAPQPTPFNHVPAAAGRPPAHDTQPGPTPSHHHASVPIVQLQQPPSPIRASASTQTDPIESEPQSQPQPQPSRAPQPPTVSTPHPPSAVPSPSAASNPTSAEELGPATTDLPAANGPLPLTGADDPELPVSWLLGQLSELIPALDPSELVDAQSKAAEVAQEESRAMAAVFDMLQVLEESNGQLKAELAATKAQNLQLQQQSAALSSKLSSQQQRLELLMQQRETNGSTTPASNPAQPPSQPPSTAANVWVMNYFDKSQEQRSRKALLL